MISIRLMRIYDPCTPLFVGGKARGTHYISVPLLLNILLASGCGSGATFRFEPEAPAATALHPNAIVLADLDRDGDLDVVVAGALSDDLWIHENMGGRL